MRVTPFACALVLTAAATAAAAGAPQASASQSDHGAAGSAKFFAEKALMANFAEVKLGELAAERAQNGDVKQFAQMMISDHTKAGAELAAAVNPFNIAAPTKLDPEHQQLYDRLSKLSGSEFDREYMRAMVDGHREVKSMVDDRASSSRPVPTGTSGRTPAGDSGLDAVATKWAINAQPAVAKHAQRAEELRNRLQ